MKSSRSILRRVIAPLSVLLVLGSVNSAVGDAIFAPGDTVLGGVEDLGTSMFQIGIVGTAGAVNNWPAGEPPTAAIDGQAAKYLNFAEAFTGILVNPSFNGGNGSVVSSMQIWTANDAVARDPSSYELWGTDEILDFNQTTFAMSDFTLISSGGLLLPAGRTTAGTGLANGFSETISFLNNNDYKSYLVVFPTVKDAAAANSMQVGEVQLFGIAAFTSLTWTGATNGVWNIETTPNWETAGAPSTFSNSNGVTFTDSGANKTITVDGGAFAGVSPANVVFEHTTGSYTIDGQGIDSTGSLTILGTGSVTLNNSNIYALGTVVTAGTLTIGAGGSLNGPLVLSNPNTGAGSAVTINFSSPLTIGSLSGSVATPASGTNSATLVINGELTVNQTTNTSFGSVISGTGGLTKVGAGTLQLTGVNVYAGPTTINEGVLVSSAPGDNPQGALPPGQPVVVNVGGTLLFGADDGLGYYSGSVLNLTVNGGRVVSAAGTHSTLPPVTLDGGTLTALGVGNMSNGSILNYILDGDITTVASATTSVINAPAILLRKNPTGAGTTEPVTFTVADGLADIDLEVSSIVRDQGAGLIKAGPGTIALTKKNEYTGPTMINAGRVVVTDSSAFGTGAVTVGTGAVLALGADSLSDFTSFTLNGGPTIDLSGSVLTLTTDAGNQARSAFTTTQVAFGSGFETTFTYTAGGARQADGATFTIQGSAPTALGGGGGQLGYVNIPNSIAYQMNIYTAGGQPVGSNFLAAVAGPYLATTPVNFGSGNPIEVKLVYDPNELTVSESLRDTVTNATYTHLFENVDLSVVGDDVGFIGFTAATGGAFASQTISNFTFKNFSEGVTLANNVTVPSDASATFEVLPLVLGGAGIATIQGELAFGSNANLAVTGGPSVTNSSFILATTGGVALNGDATLNVANNGIGTGVVAFDAISEGVAGSNFTKNGPGTLRINGAASYTGATTVNEGTLQVDGSIGGATTTVKTGAILTGSGTLASIVIENGATVVPGTGIGSITAGTILLQGGSTLELQIGTLLADQVKATGVATLEGAIALALSLLSDPADDTIFTIFDGVAALQGYSSGARFTYLGTPLDDGALFTVNNGGFQQDFSISYTADSGNDVVLVAVPEPASAASLLGGMAVLGLRRRRSTRLDS